MSCVESPRRITPTLLRVGAGLLTVLALGSVGAQPTRNDMVNECATTVADDCIVRKFKDTPAASIIRGRIVYRSYCVLCHGPEGRGDGRAARIHNPRPANLTQSRVPSEYVEAIIRRGGEAMGRYKGMPPWGEQLTDEQVSDVVRYLMTLREPGADAQTPVGGAQ